LLLYSETKLEFSKLVCWLDVIKIILFVWIHRKIMESKENSIVYG
jgi:hypothetical protein